MTPRPARRPVPSSISASTTAPPRRPRPAWPPRVRPALDICTYQGGFALHLAQVCERVTGVDASRAALEVADANLTLNAQLRAKTDWIEADAFEPAARARKPPAAASAPSCLTHRPSPSPSEPLRAPCAATKEMNLRALKMLAPGGLLVTCSCSQHVPAAGVYRGSSPQPQPTQNAHCSCLKPEVPAPIIRPCSACRRRLTSSV